MQHKFIRSYVYYTGVTHANKRQTMREHKTKDLCSKF